MEIYKDAVGELAKTKGITEKKMGKRSEIDCEKRLEGQRKLAKERL